MTRNQVLSVAAALALGLGTTIIAVPQVSYAADAGESHGSNGGGYDGHAHNGCECGGPGDGGTKYRATNPTKGKPKGKFPDFGRDGGGTSKSQGDQNGESGPGY